VILASLKNPAKHYIGSTTDLHARLQQHNRGESGYSSKYAPWRFETHLVFNSSSLAEAFERYLKSGSGHAFLKKRSLPPLIVR
jgi:predicted GIY-YIG superfamily endonuclease